MGFRFKLRQFGLAFVLALAAGMLFAAGAGVCKAGEAGGGRLKVVATTSIIGDWVKIIGKDDVDLTTLVGADGDPHEFEPVPADNISISRANIIFENGLGLENWLDKLYSSSDSKAKRIVVTAGVEVRHVAPRDGDQAYGREDDRDPHAWQSVKNAIVMVGNIRDALAAADPVHAAEYQARAGAYIRELVALDKWTQEQINSIPPQRRKLVTSHDAFGYFGQRYGIDISGSALESVTTEASDPSAKQIAEVVDQIRATGVPVIFLENTQNRKLMDQIAADAHVTVGPPLYSDALGQAGTDGDSYIKMIQHNVRVLVKALGQ
jgi:zinc/manganese transport system substrate-binding protein